uniref:hypothetical protein n=1 Tax=Microbacterium proteolyticum TaxID=1572644 RepID=UPI0024172BC7|nr:hypothetical protein [Microbacterium proteolyticum]
MRAGQIPADGAILIARAYGADPVLALLRTGWLHETDFTEGGLRSAVSVAPSSFLTEELHLRAQRLGDDKPAL